MKATKIILPHNQPVLKLIKNGAKKMPRVYINTLMPKFSYINEKGSEVVKDNCIKL